MPLVDNHVCHNDRFRPFSTRMKCLARTFATDGRSQPKTSQTFPGRSDPLQPVLLHSDLSPRNILVDDDDAGGGPRITAVLDWEFAVAGPAEEEFTFDGTKVRNRPPSHCSCHLLHVVRRTSLTLRSCFHSRGSPRTIYVCSKG